MDLGLGIRSCVYGQEGVPPGTDLARDPKLCVAVHIVSVLFVVILLVIYIWVDLQVHEDLGL
jgi:hypothetical protein